MHTTPPSHNAPANHQTTLQRATPNQWLHDTAATRRIEAQALATNPSPPLMQRAGTSLARLARAIAPHARTVWIACGPGNNGGDGLVAAAALRTAGYQVCVHWLGHPERCSNDARAAWQAATQAGIAFADGAPPELGPDDLAIDALLGIGSTAHAASTNSDLLQTLVQQLHTCSAPVLSADVPSGLQADCGQYLPGFAPTSALRSKRYTLSFLTLKPGLFTGQGRDAAGEVWWDELGIEHTLREQHPACALWSGEINRSARPHASHKGSYGDVSVIGGEGLAARGMGMGGAVILAATAALHQGAGRVMLALLDDGACTHLPDQPELMLRKPQALQWSQGVIVCGCGGGAAIAPLLAQVLTQAHRLVLDADALNAIAADPSLQRLLAERAARSQSTLLTPHPLEAARLLGCSTEAVQADRLRAASALSAKTGSTVVLKGSGTVIHSPETLPCINSSGNALLASGGTGDVLAGMLGAAWAQGLTAHQAACWATWRHGWLADQWPADRPLTAGALARCK